MELRENLVVCIGSPLIDVTARVPYAFLKKYELKPNNAISYNENCSQIFDHLQEYNPAFSVGGSITHAVLATQSLLGVPGVCCYLGAIGRDKFGEEVRQKLERNGINVHFEEIEGQSTAKCAVLLFEDNRSFVTDLGASKFLHEDFLDNNNVKNAIMNGKYYYMSAFFFRISYAITRRICILASSKNKMFIFNIGATFLCRQYVKEFKEILPYVNVLIGNEEESIQLAEALDFLDSDIKTIASFLFGKCQSPIKNGLNSSLVIITRGSKSVLLTDKNGTTEFEVPKLQLGRRLNTSGAGDFFVGGFLANFIRSKTIENCIYGGIQLSCALVKKNTLNTNYNN